MPAVQSSALRTILRKFSLPQFLWKCAPVKPKPRPPSPLDSPGKHLLASARRDDVRIGSPWRGGFALPGFIVRFADEDRRDAPHFRTESDVVVPFIANLERLH